MRVAEEFLHYIETNDLASKFELSLSTHLLDEMEKTLSLGDNIKVVFMGSNDDLTVAVAITNEKVILVSQKFLLQSITSIFKKDIVNISREKHAILPSGNIVFKTNNEEYSIKMRASRLDKAYNLVQREFNQDNAQIVHLHDNSSEKLPPKENTIQENRLTESEIVHVREKRKRRSRKSMGIGCGIIVAFAFVLFVLYLIGDSHSEQRELERASVEESVADERSLQQAEREEARSQKESEKASREEYLEQLKKENPIHYYALEMYGENIEYEQNGDEHLIIREYNGWKGRETINFLYEIRNENFDLITIREIGIKEDETGNPQPGLAQELSFSKEAVNEINFKTVNSSNISLYADDHYFDGRY